MRIAKIISGIIGLGISIYAFNNHDGFYFAPIMAWYCAIITTLITIEYWNDNFLRLLFGTITLCTYNNLTDELLFSPYVFSWNEKFFAFIISLNFIYNSLEWIRIQRQK